MYILAPRATVKCGAHITCAHEEHEKAAACGQLRSSSTHGACSKARHACSMVCAAPSQQHDHTAEGHRVVGGKGVGALWTGDRARFRTFRNRGCLARLTPLFRDRAGQHPGVPWTVRHHFSSSGPPRARRPSCGWNEGRKVVRRRDRGRPIATDRRPKTEGTPDTPRPKTQRTPPRRPKTQARRR